MKKIVTLLSTLIILLLAGCARFDSYLEKQIEEKSGVANDPDFKAYEAYSNSGSLDQDGYYLQEAFETDPSDEAVPADVTRVTFAKNEYIKAQFYADPGLSSPLSSTGGFFREGDCIYAAAALEKNAPSSTYAFSGFRIAEIDSDGNSYPLREVAPGESALVLQIGEQDIGKELSIIPLGKYLPRTISFNDSYLDNEEKEHSLSGTWTINGSPVSGVTAEINPVSSYVITYQFDSDQYFFVSSEPNCLYARNEDGVVVFNKREATDETLDYSVLLHQYVTVNLKSNQHRWVSMDNGYEHEVSANSSYEIKHLRYGEKIVLTTDVEWKELKNSKNPILLSSEKLEQGGQTAYRYTLIVPQKDGQFIFDPADYNYAHGELVFSCFGEEATTVQYLSQGSQIHYEQKESKNTDYILPQGDHVITVTTPEETKKALESITFVEKARVTVQLRQPAYGGRIEYFVNGSRINTTEYKGDSGTRITMKFYPWEGWITNYKNGEEYQIKSAPDIQAVSFDKPVFIESPEHKPLLEVVLKKSVGSGLRFEFAASGLNRKDYQYESEWYRSDYTIVKSQPIGTEKGVTISISNGAIQSGTAIKIQVEMMGEDKSGVKTQKVTKSYYRLINNLAENIAPIDIYESATMGSSDVWYKNIKITISLVDVVEYVAPRTPAKGIVTIRNAQTGETLKPGNILEGSEKVTVTISAYNGYYVDGSNTKNGVYQTTTTFEKCVAGIQKMVDDHPVRKYCKISLNANDPHGTCIFKYAGKVVSGTINVKPGEAVTLEYSITDPKYVIDGATGFLGSPLGKNDKEVKKDLTITGEYDGKTLTTESFGIVVKKG